MESFFFFKSILWKSTIVHKLFFNSLILPSYNTLKIAGSGSLCLKVPFSFLPQPKHAS